VLAWQALFEANMGLRTVETLELRVDAAPYEPGWITPDGKSLCVRRAKGQESVNPFVKVHEGLARVISAWRRWKEDRFPDSPWFFPSPIDPSQPVDKCALGHALRRLRKPAKGPDGEVLAPFLARKITSHALRAWYVTVRRSHGIADNIIA
jgi:integrase